MSELEHTIEIGLKHHGVTFMPQAKIPVEVWPWKQPRSHQPKCDIFLPDGKIYVEVKGFMTIHAMAKMAWFTRQGTFNYYILQGTEEDWNPYIDSPLGIERGLAPTSKHKLREQNIAHQIKELVWLSHNSPEKASSLSLRRLQSYIVTRIAEYESWNGKWF